MGQNRNMSQEHLLIMGVISEGLRLCAMCSLLPGGPGTPLCPCCSISLLAKSPQLQGCVLDKTDIVVGPLCLEGDSRCTIL